MVTVSFPGLGLEFNINRVAFSLGSFDVYWYGVLLGAALAIGILYACWRAKEFGLNSDRMLDVIILGAVFAVVGGRLYYVLCDLENYKTFASWFDLRSGGIAMYGVLIGAFVGAAIGCKIRKVKTLPMFDLAALGFIMSQPAGRLANFINQEAFGYNTSLPWSMYSTSTKNYLTTHAAELAEKGMIVDPTKPVHPYFLYEGLWTIAGTIVLNLYAKKRKFDGEIFLMYVVWYGTGRAVLESLRTDSLYVGPFRTSQLVAAISVLIAAALILIVRAKQRKDPEYRPVYGHTEQCAADLAALEQEKVSRKKKKQTDETVSDIELPPEQDAKPKSENEPEATEPEDKSDVSDN